MLLDEAKATDVQVTVADVRRAEREATEAEELAAELERQAVEDGSATPAQVVEQRELSRFARARVELTRKRADRAAAARRLLALAEVGADVDKLAAAAAAGPGKPFEQAARKLAEAAETMRRLSSAHDTQVEELRDRAMALDVEPPAAGGPRASSAFVSLNPGAPHRLRGIRHRAVEVRMVGGVVHEAIAKAIEGDVDGAIALVTVVNQPPEQPARPDHLFIRGDGMIFHGTPQLHADALAHGRLREATPAEIDAYMEGTLDGHH